MKVALSNATISIIIYIIVPQNHAVNVHTSAPAPHRSAGEFPATHRTPLFCWRAGGAGPASAVSGFSPLWCVP